MKLLFHNFLFLSFLIFCLNAEECAGFGSRETNGTEIMEEVYRRHQQFPYIYEEQSMVMVDRNGDRDTRKTKRYSRVEEDGSVRFLLLFDYPSEVKGVALLANRNPEGQTNKYIYLPAYGKQLLESAGEESGDNFLGTDFSVENLTGEILAEHHYVRREDEEKDGVKYFIVDVAKARDPVAEKKILRRHYIRQDNLFITLTHHYDRHGRIARIQSSHDLKEVDQNRLAANMVLMENKKDQHQSLIKISRRILSDDYVPAEIFTAEWLYENYPKIEPDEENNEESPLELEESTE
ncbi:MAG: outer membrane lipoprotein-sorting protein [Nitrospinae bacterium]|nr:outer membrane lipoprotein-sorting protein [Nitrospinota bacterium]